MNNKPIYVMNDHEAPAGDSLDPLLFSDQSLPSLSEFITLLGQYKRAVYEHYAVYVDQLV